MNRPPAPPTPRPLNIVDELRQLSAEQLGRLAYPILTSALVLGDISDHGHEALRLLRSVLIEREMLG